MKFGKNSSSSTIFSFSILHSKDSINLNINIKEKMTRITEQLTVFVIRVGEKIRDSRQHTFAIDSLRLVDGDEPLVFEDDIALRERKQRRSRRRRQGPVQLYVLGH